jgi:hypothetical protein
VGVFESYAPVCMAPCEADLDANAMYRVGGKGVAASDTFALPRGQPRLALKVNAGSSSARGWGWASAVLGGTAIATGASFLLVSSMLSNSTDGTSAQQSMNNTNDTFRTIGLVSLAGGAGLLALGIALIATNGTDVKTESGQTIGKAQIPLPGKLALSPSGIVF